MGDSNARGGGAALSRLSEDALWSALVRGVGDFVRTYGNGSALVGISGGIDSALVACVATEALGADRVLGVLLPSPYTTQESVDAAGALIGELGIRSLTLPIAPVMDAYAATLALAFAGREADVTEENLQARIRGTLLMALSNKFGHLLLNTGNKSEAAVGYCTLYGDSCGALAVIGDVYKGTVYALGRHVNAVRGRQRIPEVILNRAPSAELRPGQKDEDELPPYEQLDRMLHDHLEGNMDAAALSKSGHDPHMARKVCRMVERAAFKRRQSPPALCVSARPFGADGRPLPPEKAPGNEA
jgi:NAD+ synthetase